MTTVLTVEQARQWRQSGQAAAALRVQLKRAARRVAMAGFTMVISDRFGVLFVVNPGEMGSPPTCKQFLQVHAGASL